MRNVDKIFAKEKKIRDLSKNPCVIPTILEQLPHFLGALEVYVLQELLQRRLGALEQGGGSTGEGHPNGGFPQLL